MKRISAFLVAIFVAMLVQHPASGAVFDEDDFKTARKEAEQGDAEAALALGMMYYSGEGTPQNYDEAAKWYRRSADKGNAIAQNSLGIMYLNGHGVPVNFFEAAKWIRAAAEKGNPRAQINLGGLYADGKGVPRNKNEASKWYHRAAEQGDAEAGVTLGRLYIRGDIVSRDFVVAYMWFLLAGAKGNDAAATERDALRSKMSNVQIAEAQRLAAAFVPRRDPGETPTPRWSGTGFIVTTNGYLLTAYHVVEDRTNIVVRSKKIRFAARLIKADKTNDVALLKIIGAYAPTPTNAASGMPGKSIGGYPSPLINVIGNFRPLMFAADDGIKLGEAVSTLGFPNPEIQGREAKFTRGEVNSLAGIKDDARYYQISAPVQPGNSGGPLLNGSGRVVGMVLSRLNDITLLKTTGSVPQNVNYALKSSKLVALIKSLPALKNNLPAAAEENNSDGWLAAVHESVVLIEVY